MNKNCVIIGLSVIAVGMTGAVVGLVRKYRFSEFRFNMLKKTYELLAKDYSDVMAELEDTYELLDEDEDNESFEPV
mgnify:CR=1 FL=1